MSKLLSDGNFTNISPGSIASLRLAEGGAYLFHSMIELKRGATSVTRAQLLEDVHKLRVKINHTTVWDIKIADYLAYLKHYTRGATDYDTTNKILPIYWFEPWLDNFGEKLYGGWPIHPDNVKTFEINLELTSTSKVTKIECFSLKGSRPERVVNGALVPEPLGDVTILHQVIFSKSTNESTVFSNLPKGRPLTAMAFRNLDPAKDANETIEEIRIRIDHSEVAVVRPRHMRHLAAFRQNPDLNQVEKVYFHDFVLEGRKSVEAQRFVDGMGRLVGDFSLEIVGEQGDYEVTMIEFGKP
jgi:hypothetical protein